MKEPKRENRGITLIALIVTIIVLLILAGVTIATLTGDNGILTKAQEAKDKTEQAEKDEKSDLAEIEDLMNESLNGIHVEKVTDQNPGVLEIDEENENIYIINSIEDLVFFAYDVTNGNNYEDKTIELGLSLDFNSTKSYVDPFRTDYTEYGYNGQLKTLLTTGEGFLPIGALTDSTTQNFYGTFDGKGNSINNLYINKINDNDRGIKVGLFTNNRGNIYNVKLLNVDLYLKSNTGSLGGISGQNSKTGKINRMYCFWKYKK